MKKPFTNPENYCNPGRFYLKIRALSPVLILLAQFYTYQVYASNLHKPNDFLTQKPLENWTIIYSDASMKVYYETITCDGVQSVRLKFENLTSNVLNISYKIWSSSTSKTIELNSLTTLEGVCAIEYNNLLIESIPAGSSISNMNVSINYLP